MKLDIKKLQKRPLPESLLPAIRDSYVPSTLWKAWQEISDREHWHTNCNARTWCGLSIYPTSPAAYSFCAVGALIKVCPSRNSDRPHLFLCRAAFELFNTTPTNVNDHFGWQSVREMYRLAILLALTNTAV